MTTGVTNGMLTALVSHKGAELVSLRDASGREYIWEGDKAVWPRHAPVLFPVVGRLRHDRFTWGGKSYTMSQHGFARDMEFRLAERSGNRCVFELHDDPRTRAMYPFGFVLRIVYTISERELEVRYEVFNPSSDDVLPFSIGAHPGFSLPLEAGAAYEDHFLEFETGRILIRPLKEGLRTGPPRELTLRGTRLHLSDSMFDNDALVIEGGQVERVTLGTLRGNTTIVMRCEGWPYFGIWAKKGTRRFICLEPWHGIADNEDTDGSLERKEGMITLAPGAGFSCVFSMRF